MLLVQITPKNRDSIVWPEVSEVIEQVRLTNFTGAGRIYNCTDNAVRKFLVRNGVDLNAIK